MSATPALRRLLVPIVLVVLGALVAARLRARATPALRADPPVWPPLPPRPAGQPVAAATSSADTTTVSATANATPVVAEPDAAWAPPDDGGGCPIGFPVKAKEASGIYHLPDGRFYDRTNADRCYVDADAAESDGYRRSKT